MSYPARSSTAMSGGIDIAAHPWRDDTVTSWCRVAVTGCEERYTWSKDVLTRLRQTVHRLALSRHHLREGSGSLHGPRLTADHPTRANPGTPVLAGPGWMAVGDLDQAWPLSGSSTNSRKVDNWLPWRRQSP